MQQTSEKHVAEQSPFGSSCAHNDLYPDASCASPNWVSTLPVAGGYALNAHGNVAVDGTLVVSQDVQTASERFGRFSVDDVVDKLFLALQGTACTSTPCIYGFPNPVTCDCVCLDGWTGTQCADLDCFNGALALTGACVCDEGYDIDTNCRFPKCEQGVYNKELGICECLQGYSGQRCETAEEFSNCTVSAGCGCGPFFYGPDTCEYDCTARGVLEGKCIIKIENYGYDQCHKFTDTGQWVCVCGGGFAFETTNVTMTVVHGADPLQPPMAELCSPFSRGKLVFACPTQSCCEDISPSACALFNCGYNSGTGKCEFNANVSAALSGIAWDTVVSDCTPPTSDVRCRASPRLRYLEVYTQAKDLVVARDLINTMNWIDLAKENFILASTFVIYGNNTGLCSTGQPYIQASEAAIPEIVELKPVCATGTATATRFRLIDVPWCGLFDTQYYALMFEFMGAMYCIGQQRSDNTLLQFALSLKTSTPAVVGQAFAADKALSFLDRASLCAGFSLEHIEQLAWKDSFQKQYLFMNGSTDAPNLAWGDGLETMQVKVLHT